MVYRFIVTSCLALLLPALAVGQSPKTLEQLTKEVQDLQQQLATTTANLTRLTEAVADNVAAIGSNKQEIDQLKTDIQEEQAKQRQILDAITQKDSQGNDVLRLSANMDASEEFRDDVRKAVHRSLETHGEFSIHNRMTAYQRIIVNQKEYGLNPDEILTLKVPVGTVTARLPGQALTNWTVGTPNYSQKVDIVPDGNTTTAYRPISDSESNSVVPWYSLSPLSREPVYLTPLPPPVYVGPVAYYVLPN